MDGDDAAGFCRSEFQAFCKWFVDPLMQRTVELRYKRSKKQGAAAPQDCGGRRFWEVYEDWQAKLRGAYELCVPFETPRKDLPKQGWRAFKAVPTSAYKPRSVPYFLTLDRASPHSFWKKTKTHKKKHKKRPGVPLLQIIFMPPHGHDLHQIAEHAIGAAKGHVRGELLNARRQSKRLTTLMAYNAMMEGSELYTGKSWLKNLVRLQHCCRIVAAPCETILEVETVNSKNERVTKYVRGTFGGYCPKAWS